MVSHGACPGAQHQTKVTLEIEPCMNNKKSKQNNKITTKAGGIKLN
jgi:hypothetical protein